MRRPLSAEQRRSVEELVQEKGETCGLCGNVVLRCDKDAAPYLGGGYSVRLRCTNPTDDEEHAGGFGLAWDYSLTPEDAQRVGLS